MLISDANAQVPGIPGGWAGLTDMLPLIILFVLLYFMILRPQMKRSKEHKIMLEGLQKGDEVVAAGLLGKIMKVGDNFVSIEVSSNVVVSVQKPAVSQLLPKGTIKAAQ